MDTIDIGDANVHFSMTVPPRFKFVLGGQMDGSGSMIQVYTEFLLDTDGKTFIPASPEIYIRKSTVQDMIKTLLESGEDRIRSDGVIAEWIKKSNDTNGKAGD